MTRETSPQKLLFKYQDCDNYALENLEENAIWFSKPLSFDDPYDCAIHIERLGADRTDVENLMSFWKRKGILFNVSYDPKLEEILMLDISIQKLIKDIKKSFNSLRNEILNNFRIACFSETNIDFLMWSLYAGGHKGFCLEFDKNTLPFNQALEVNYQTRIPTINLIDSFIDIESNRDEKSKQDKLLNLVHKLLLTKAKYWEFQKEWRIIQKFNQQKVTIGFASLTGVYFGIRMSQENQNKVMSILKGRNVCFYQMKKNENLFKLDYERI